MVFLMVSYSLTFIKLIREPTKGVIRDNWIHYSIDWFINHMRTDDEILVKIFISTVAADKILVIRSTYI